MCHRKDIQIKMQSFVFTAGAWSGERKLADAEKAWSDNHATSFQPRPELEKSAVA